VLPDPLHARTDDLARRLGAQPAPKTSRSTAPPPLRSPDDLSARPASQTLGSRPLRSRPLTIRGGPESGLCRPPCPHRYPPRRFHGRGQLPPRFGASRGAPRPLKPSDPRFSCVRVCAATYPPVAHSTPSCPHCVCRRIADCVPASPIFVAGLPPPGALPPRPLACSAESGRAVGAGRRAAQPGPRSGHPVVRQPRWPLSGTGAPRAVCISSPVTLPAPSGGVWGVGEVRNVDLSPRCPYCDHLYHCSAIFTVTVCFLNTWFTRAILVLSQATVDAISQLDIGPPILADHHIWPRMLARATNMQNYTAGTRAHDSCMALDWPSPSGRWMNVSNTGDNGERQHL